MRSSITILAPVERVFDFIDDWRNASSYMRGLDRWRPVDPDVVRGVGSRFDVAIKAGPTRLTGRVEVTEHEPPASMVFRSMDGPRVVGRWSLWSDGDGTHVELDADYELPGGIAGRLVASVVGRQGQRDLDASLRELKRLVEGG